MIITYSNNNVPIRLTIERWSHILYRHPEMAYEKDKVIETLNSPEMIQKGEKTKQVIQIQNLKDALTYAEQDIKDRWEWYKERFKKGMKQ